MLKELGNLQQDTNRKTVLIAFYLLAFILPKRKDKKNKRFNIKFIYDILKIIEFSHFLFL